MQNEKNNSNVRNNDTGWDIRISREGESNTISHAGEKRLSEYGLAGIRGLIENAVLLDSEIHEHRSDNAKNDLIAFDHKLYSIGKDTGGNVALYRITVEEAYQDIKHTNERSFHNLRYIEKVATVGGRTAGQSLHDVSTNDNIATDYIMSEIYDFVKKYDKDFNSEKEVNSALLNKDGTPKVFYHGAKNGGGFNVFRQWQYFTDRKEYADRYADRNNPESLYNVYLKSSKPFDTRESAARKIFEEIRNEYGLTEIQDSGLPDWTDGYDLCEYLDLHPELGYDSVILDEGGDLVNGKPKRRGNSIVIKDSTQIKSAQNAGTFDSNNEDIRYSISVDDVSDSRADIVSNEKYQKLVEDLKRKYQYAKETLHSEGIGNKSHTPIMESNASDISIADLSLFVNFKIIKKNAPCKGCINIISKIRLLSAPRLLFR